MGEGKGGDRIVVPYKGPSLPDRFHQRKAQLEHALSPTRRSVSKELTDIKEAVGRGKGIRLTELPAVLQVNLGTDQYTSIRRLDGSGLTFEEHPSDKWTHEIETRVKADLIPEGGVGLLFLPHVDGARPVSPDAQRFLDAQNDLTVLHRIWLLKFALKKRISI